ncbi:hypothetical protein HAX54_022429 [Datura stramonium]|uniref:Uncharacterized protein n=1 Tax=Datura stramonium TaxID=4076 RepID=A0ABS8UVG5_DATST|nr:hypothetical protein [Datura stramonium]
MWSNGEVLLSERAKCRKAWLDGCSRQGMKMAREWVREIAVGSGLAAGRCGWATRQGVAEDLARKTGRWRQILPSARLRTCAHAGAHTGRRGQFPFVMPRRHWLGMTSAGCGSSASGWMMCMAFSQDKADLSDVKAALIKQRAKDRRMAPAGHACKRCDDSRTRRACALTWAPAYARTWALTCARTWQTRRENRSWQAQAGARTRQTRRENRSWQAHARGRCGAKSGTDPEILGMWLVSALYAGTWG